MKVESESLSLFIPLHPKDIPILPMTIDTLRRYAIPKIDDVTVIASEKTRKKIASLLKEKQVNFLDEDKLIPGLNRKNLPKIIINGEDRAGWFYQQFLKFEVCNIVKHPSYLVFDADCVALKPTHFIENGRYVFHRATQYYEPYFRTHEELFGYKPERELSYISDFMVYDQKAVKELISKIEKRWSCRWYEAVLRIVTSDTSKSFAEPETYGYFMSKFHPGIMVSKRGKSLSLPRRLSPYHLILKYLLQLKYNTVSYHCYTR